MQQRPKLRVVACGKRLFHAPEQRGTVSQKNANKILDECAVRAQLLQVPERFAVDYWRWRLRIGRGYSNGKFRAARRLRFSDAQGLHFLEQPQRLDRLGK